MLSTVTVTSGEAQLCRKRVFKEYEMIMESPLPNVYIAKEEQNHLNWYCLIHGLEEPYLGGEYLFLIQLSPRYPLAPPDFYMLTPNGRFEVNRKLCFSNSSFHGETWSPIWNIRTIVLGFLSFFLEDDSKGVGHLQMTREEKLEFARLSKSFNDRNNPSKIEMIKLQNRLT